MQGPSASAVAFALSGGEPADPRLRLFADELPGTGQDHSRRLLVAVEPLEPSRRGLEVAASALEALRAAFEAAADEAVTLALVRAMAAADALVEVENRSSPAEERDHRVMIGATAIAIEGSIITVAQLPPSQAMLIQDGFAYGLPAMESWSPEFVAESDETSAEPLGTGGGVAPLLFRSAISPGDLIVLCDSALARCLGEGKLVDGNGSKTKVRSLEDALSWLEGVAARNDLEEVQAACIAVPPTLDLPERYAHLTSPKRGPRWLKVANNRHRSSPFGSPPEPPADTATMPLPPVEPLRPVRVAPAPTDEGVQMGTRFSPVTDVAPASEGDADRGETAATPGGEVEPGKEATDTESELAPERAEAAEEAPPLDTLGETIPSADLARDRPVAAVTPEPTPWWRVGERPRLHRLGPPSYLIAALLAVVTICGTTGLWHGRQVARAQHAESLSSAFAIVDAVLNRAAQSAADPDDLGAAAAALSRAERLGAPAAMLADRRTALGSYEDALQGVVRLGGLTRIGGLPPELAALGTGSPGLVRANRELYLVAGGFYRLDFADNSLVPVLTPGSEIGEHVVGSLTAGAWAPGGIAVTDGTAIYTIDASSTWSVQPLGADSPATWSDAPGAMLNGAFYLLNDLTGEIRKFDLEQPTGSGETWLPASEGEPLRSALDMVIDGDVHVLLPDGRIATMANGAVTGIRPVEVDPPLSEPIALTGGMDASALWILDQAGGEPRLTRVEAGGGEPKSFRLTIPAGIDAETALVSLHDVAVDEVGHVVYFLTDTAIWRADLPVFVPVG